MFLTYAFLGNSLEDDTCIAEAFESEENDATKDDDNDDAEDGGGVDEDDEEKAFFCFFALTTTQSVGRTEEEGTSTGATGR